MCLRYPGIARVRGTHPRIRDIICRATEASDSTMLLQVVSHLLQQDCKDKKVSRTLERQGSVDSGRSW